MHFYTFKHNFKILHQLKRLGVNAILSIIKQAKLVYKTNGFSNQKSDKYHLLIYNVVRYEEVAGSIYKTKALLRGLVWISHFVQL
jgi:hypothetical protein